MSWRAGVIGAKIIVLAGYFVRTRAVHAHMAHALVYRCAEALAQTDGVARADPRCPIIARRQMSEAQTQATYYPQKTPTHILAFMALSVLLVLGGAIVGLWPVAALGVVPAALTAFADLLSASGQP